MLTAMDIMNQAIDAGLEANNTAEAITLYLAAAQTFLDEGSPEDAEVCERMAVMVAEG